MSGCLIIAGVKNMPSIKKPGVSQTTIDRLTDELGRQHGDLGEEMRIEELQEKRHSPSTPGESKARRTLQKPVKRPD
jgi:hypothetical protein